MRSLKILFVFIIPVLFSSCTIQKRRYNRGFHIEGFSNHKSESSIKTQHLQRIKPVSVPDFSSQTKFEFRSARLIKELSQTIVGYQKEKDSSGSANNYSGGTDSVVCDIIFLRNGDEIEAKVLEISETEVRYKMCDNPDGPVFIKSVNSVFMIKYPNGTKTVFERRVETHVKADTPSAGSSEQPTSKSKDDLSLPGSAMIGFIFGITGLFLLQMVLGPLAVVFGLIGVTRITNNPEKYRGSGLAVAAIVIGFIDLMLFFIFLV